MFASALLGMSGLSGINRRSVVVPASNLGIDPHQWFRADVGTYQDSTFTTVASADGDPVGGLACQSGRGSHARQATSTKRGTLKTNVLNSKPVVRFDGVDDFLSTPTAPYLDAAVTVFLVWRDLTEVGSFPGSVGKGIINQVTQFFRTSSTDKMLFRATAAPQTLTESGTTALNAWVLWCGRYQGGQTCTLRKNGSQVASASPATALSTGGISWFLGALGLDNTGATATNFGNGDLAELVVFHSLLGDTEVGAIETAINARWAVY